MLAKTFRKIKSVLEIKVNFFKLAFWALLAAFIFSLLAIHSWFFDLFSHFTLQYMIGGMGLFVFFTLYKNWRYAVVSLLIGILSFVEVRLTLDNPYQFHASQVKEEGQHEITIMQYNHLLFKEDFSSFEEWLRTASKQPDIIIFQEANENTVKFAESIINEYPFQIYEDTSHAFGMVAISKAQMILSKANGASYEKLHINGPRLQNFILKTKIELENEEILNLYALHTLPPVGHKAAQQRNLELAKAAEVIKGSKDENVVLIGDWNITPFSPYFKKLRQNSGLSFQSTGVFMNASWPSFLFFDFLKIPIDHVLYSSDLRFVDKKAISAFGSDHHAIMVTLRY